MSSSGGHAGRPKSWVAVVVMFIGFLVAGLALPLGPLWVMFWVGVAIVVVGGLIAVAVDITSDVVVAQPYVSADPVKRAEDEQRAKAAAAATSATSAETVRSHS